MNPENRTKKQDRIWLLAALTVPAVQCASRCSWLSAAVVSGAALLVNWQLPKYLKEPGVFVSNGQAYWNCLVIALVLGWVRDCWPSHREPYGAALILLTLAAYLTAGGKERAAGVGCVVIWMVWLLLGAAILPAVPHIKWQRLIPQWSMPDGNLLTVLLLPLLSGRKKGSTAAIGGGLAIVTAGIVTGILSVPVAAKIRIPVYEVNRSVSFPVSDIRMESLSAIAITLGCFITICYLLGISTERGKSDNVWRYAILSAVLYIIGVREYSAVIGVGSIVAWMVLPVLGELKNIMKKSPKKS